VRPAHVERSAPSTREHDVTNDTSETPAAVQANAEPARKRTWRRTWKRARRRAGLALVTVCGPFVLRRLSRTWKLTLHGVENFAPVEREHTGHFMALWHGRMLLGLPHHGEREWVVLVSPSGDGDISQRLLEGFRYRVIRGSSSRGGAQALREMLAELARGSVLVITPDGPRGPRHTMNPGLAWMARATGRPIVPLGFAVDRAWRLGSWDRFTIPKPGARIAMVYGEPVRVARDARPEELELATRTVQERMLAAETRAALELGVARDW